MKEKTTGIISFITGLGWALWVVFIVLTSGNITKGEEIFGLSVVLLSAISTVLYVLWTQFGKKEFNELEKISYENKLLQKQIERKELKQKLKD